MEDRGSKVWKVGVVGCGAIGRRIAKTVSIETHEVWALEAVYDISMDAADALSKELDRPDIVKKSLDELVQSADLIVEAVNSDATQDIVYKAIEAGKPVLVMSAGRILSDTNLFLTARKKGVPILIPSGAIAGLDAIQAAAEVGIDSLILITRKPVDGFKDVEYIEKNVDLSKISGEVVLFEGGVEKAVKAFPQNINVAATLALSSGNPDKVVIRIITSPAIKHNSHEIIAEGEFGRIETKTENVICPDNPKTSYMAVLSAVRALRKFCSGIYIGT